MSKSNVIWQEREICDPSCDALRAIKDYGRLDHVAAQILQTRNVVPDNLAEYLKPEDQKINIGSPYPDMVKGLEIVSEYIKKGKRIYIHGDYDVDGISSTSIMHRTFKALGANFESFVPHRINDGYDIKPHSVERALKAGAELLITVDCGTRAIAAADKCEELGLPLIITDHHQPHADGRLPKCLALINPHLSNNPNVFKEVCGATIAFKFCMRLAKMHDADVEKLGNLLLPLAALGTVADVMPLVGENRTLAVRGCKMMSECDIPGLIELIDVAQVGSEVSPSDIGFRLGPRINAAGRIDAASDALELMTTEDTNRAFILAQKLDSLNTRRQDMQADYVSEATYLVNEYLSDAPIIVIADERWHVGIVGLIASRLAETFGKPAMVGQVIDNIIKGSCRTFGDFNILEAMSHESVSPLFTAFGGHKKAAGFTIDRDNFDLLRENIADVSKRQTISLDVPTYYHDGELQLREVNNNLLNSVLRLVPYGERFAEPSFVIRNLNIKQKRVLKEKHLKLTLEQKNQWIDALWFNCPESTLAQIQENQEIDILCHIQKDAIRKISDKLSLKIIDLVINT